MLYKTKLNPSCPYKRLGDKKRGKWARGGSVGTAGSNPSEPSSYTSQTQNRRARAKAKLSHSHCAWLRTRVTEVIDLALERGTLSMGLCPSMTSGCS